VGCDLYTTDSFEATDGWVYVRIPTGVETDHPVAAKTRLGTVAPNPAAHGALVSYYLAEPSRVSVAVYDAMGRRIKTLETGPRNKGWHEVNWEGTDNGGREISSGVYFVRLRAGSATFGKKLTVVR
jgi:hypothetical protein